MSQTPPLILASQSPRRAQLLREAGIAFEQRSPPYADPDQPPEHLRGHEAEEYAASLAKQKAKSLAEVLSGPALVLAADTICVDAEGNLVGKPIDRADAQQMLSLFINSTHGVITGVAMMNVIQQSDNLAVSLDHSFADTATVCFGALTDEQLDDYLSNGDWQGKAGGYNLFDRQAAGWPITVQGDPSTVVGLPMQRLTPLLAPLIHSDR